MTKIEDKRAGDDVVSVITITHHANGSLQVQGPMQDKAYVLAVLENAKDAVKNHRRPDMVDLIIPGRDVSIERG